MQLMWTCYTHPPTHTLTKDSPNTMNFIPYTFRIVCGFSNVAQGTYEHGRYFGHEAYGL